MRPASRPTAGKLWKTVQRRFISRRPQRRGAGDILAALRGESQRNTPGSTPLNQSLALHANSTLLSDVSPAPSARLSYSGVPGVTHDSSSLCYTPSQTTPAWSGASPFGDINRMEPQTSPKPERSSNASLSDLLPDVSMPDLGGALGSPGWRSRLSVSRSSPGFRLQMREDILEGARRLCHLNPACAQRFLEIVNAAKDRCHSGSALLAAPRLSGPTASSSPSRFQELLSSRSPSRQSVQSSGFLNSGLSDIFGDRTPSASLLGERTPNTPGTSVLGEQTPSASLMGEKTPSSFCSSELDMPSPQTWNRAKVHRSRGKENKENKENAVPTCAIPSWSEISKMGDLNVFN